MINVILFISKTSPITPITINKSSIEAIMSRLNEICLTVRIFDNDFRYKI